MRGAKVFMAVVAAGALAFWGGVALASNEASKAPEGSKATATEPSKAPEGKKATTPKASKPVFHRIRGEVTAVEPGARTMTVKTMQGKKELTVGVDITDKTVIRQGRAHKTLPDLKVGDRVWMRYERTNDKLVADYIRILRPQHVAAKK